MKSVTDLLKLNSIIIMWNLVKFVRSLLLYPTLLNVHIKNIGISLKEKSLIIT